MVGGVMGVYTFDLKLNQTHWHQLKVIVFHYYCHSGSFHTYLFDCFIKSLIWYQLKWGGRGCQSTWTPCALYVWKISIFGLLYGLDLLNISWSFVTMCAYHVGSGKFHGDLVITCLWKYLKCSTWCFIMSTYILCCGYYVTFHGRLHLNLSWLKDYISFQPISNHYLSS